MSPIKTSQTTTKPSQPGADRPGYKHTALGWIPEDWEVCKLGEALTLQRGHDLTEVQRKNGKVPVYTSGGFTGYHNVSKAVAPGIVMGRYGTLGEIYYVDEDFWPHNTTLYVKEFKKVKPKFAYYLLASINMGTYSGKSAVPGINRNDLHIEKIPLPPLPEQTAIANLLSTWDAAITRLQALIDAKTTRKKWLMQQLLTGKKRLPGFEGAWEKVTYGDLLKVVKRSVEWDDNDLYQLISVRRRSGGIFERERLYGHQIKVKDLRTAKAGDFLFSKMQIVHGASALVTPEFDGAKISGSYIAVVASQSSKLDMNFFNWYSRMPYFYHQTYVSSYGVHIEKMTFDFESFLGLAMHLPTLEEQQAIVKILSASENQITLLQKQLEQVKEQKKGLMQQLLTGKKRLTKINFVI